MNSELQINDKKCLKHKEWRRIAKKERRRRVRCKNARERDADEDRLRVTLEKSADYLNWVKEQEKFEVKRERKEQEDHEEQEKQWLEAEVKAQNEFKELQIRKAKARQAQLEQEEKIRKEFEEKQAALRRKKEELQRQQEEELKRQEIIEQEIEDYINSRAKTPEIMRITTDSQPGKELCPFFSKTAACKYGDSCSRNHRRSALTKIILIPGFYNHFSLEKTTTEYDTDIGLEFETSETRKHFREFYKDVVPELESYGRIKTLKCCCNSEMHLRGNLYVEYHGERDAARAWRNLKGRWYAGKQLNCEFANFTSWRSAVCGMNKCPKGRACNYLHTFTNYTDDYEIKSPPRRKKADRTESVRSEASRRSQMSGFDDGDSKNDERRHWRWSESPETHRPYFNQEREEKNFESRSKDFRGKREGGRSERSSRRRDSSKSRSRRETNSSSSRRKEEREENYSSSRRKENPESPRREEDFYSRRDKNTPSSKRKEEREENCSSRREKNSPSSRRKEEKEENRVSRRKKYKRHEKHEEKYKRKYEIDKENGNDFEKTKKRTKREEVIPEKPIASEENYKKLKLEKYDSEKSQKEIFEKDSVKIKEMEMKNNWDTTDSEDSS